MASRLAIISELAGRIRQLERSRCRAHWNDAEPTEHSPSRLRRLLAGGDWPRGSLVEWLSDGDGAGAMSLAALAFGDDVRRELLVVVDGRGEFYAPAAVALGMDFRSTVFIRPERSADVLWSAEQALRTPGVGTVICQPERLSSQECRRLQLAAETGGSLGILLRPERVRNQPSFAECRLLVRPLATAGPVSASHPRRRLLVELLRARRGFNSESVIVELDDADGRVCLVGELASATAAARATGA